MIYPNKKLCEMESLLAFLSDLFKVSTTEAASRLLYFGINSFDDFISAVEDDAYAGREK